MLYNKGGVHEQVHDAACVVASKNTSRIFTTRDVFLFMREQKVKIAEDQVRRALYAMARTKDSDFQPVRRATYVHVKRKVQNN